MEEVKEPSPLKNFMPDRFPSDGLELLAMWQSAVGDPSLYFSCLALTERQREAAVGIISQKLKRMFDPDALQLPETAPVTKNHILQVNVLIDKAINETQALGEVLLGADYPDETDQCDIDPRSFFATQAGIIEQVSITTDRLDRRTLDDINQLEPEEKLKLFEMSELAILEYMETAQAFLATWALSSLEQLVSVRNLGQSIRRPLAVSHLRVDFVKNATSEERNQRRYDLFQSIMLRCAYKIVNEVYESSVDTPQLKRAVRDLNYVVQLYEALADTHTRVDETLHAARMQFYEMQESEARHRLTPEQEEIFVQRLQELPTELEVLIESRRISVTQLKKEGLRQDLLDLETKYGLEREDARQLMGFMWLLRQTVARIGAEKAQQLLEIDLRKERIIYWIADRILARVNAEGTLPEELPLARMVDLARQNWEPLNMIIRKYTEKGTRGLQGDMKAVVFLEDLNPQELKERKKSKLPPLTLEQARQQMALLRTLADVYEAANIVDMTLLPEPVRHRIVQTRSQPVEVKEEPSPEQELEQAPETPERHIQRRRLLARVDGGRVSTLHALKGAYEKAEFFTENVFATFKDRLPYIAVVFDHVSEYGDVVTYAIAENPEIDNATYVYASGPGQPSWRKAFEANREDARILYDAIQVKHPHTQTAAEHMEEIIAALIAFGLPPKIANVARYTLRDWDPNADKLWVPSDDVEALETITKDL